MGGLQWLHNWRLQRLHNWWLWLWLCNACCTGLLHMHNGCTGVLHMHNGWTSLCHMLGCCANLCHMHNGCTNALPSLCLPMYYVSLMWTLPQSVNDWSVEILVLMHSNLFQAGG